jgi:hypothetical protein
VSQLRSSASTAPLVAPLPYKGEVRATDFACPGLMLAANASLVLGYLWIGWLSVGSGSGTALSFVRDAALPLLVTALVLVMRRSTIARGLPGSTALLPIAAAVQLGTSIAAAVAGTRSLAVIAGASALLLAATAIGSVVLREVRARRFMHRGAREAELLAAGEVTPLPLASVATRLGSRFARTQSAHDGRSAAEGSKEDRGRTLLAS